MVDFISICQTTNLYISSGWSVWHYVLVSSIIIKLSVVTDDRNVAGPFKMTDVKFNCKIYQACCACSEQIDSE
jgi:hypothetical protein